ncbi:MAG: glycosyltransferase family 4 protein [Acidimicrobiales bacterium]
MPDALLFDPDLATLGGGERYLFSLADHLGAAADVTIAAPVLPSPERMRTLGFEDRWPLELLPLPDLTSRSEDFDTLVYLSLDLPLPSRARRSYLVVQFPFFRLTGRRHPRARRHQRRALAGYRLVVYSSFAQAWVRRRWGGDATVLPPPVRLGRYQPEAKSPCILSVGRFFPQGHSKRQDVLVEAYKRLPDAVREGWPLVLAGGCTGDAVSARYLADLRRAAAGHDVHFAVNVPQAELEDLYRRASLFWHATGYGRPPDRPEAAEHFGLATVEAMSYGCVPMVYADGGQTEIVRSGHGMLWTTTEELVDMTGRLVQDADERQRLAIRAAEASQEHGYPAFRERCGRLFEAL